MKEQKTLPPAIFLAGAQALDFLNSVATPVDETVEWLGNGADLLAWMKQAGFLTDDDLRMIKEIMSVTQLDEAAKDARALRDWFRRFVHEHRGRAIKERAFEQFAPINRLLEADAAFWQIELCQTLRYQAGNTTSPPAIFALRQRWHWRKPASLLSPLVEEIARFICTADFRHIKACEGGKCTLLFLDQSHRHGRRWCSMAICGNRAKAAAFAARSKRARRKTK
jgi:predicted RNA-binding Zn ribbon-like protein